MDHRLNIKEGSLIRLSSFGEFRALIMVTKIHEKSYPNDINFYDILGIVNDNNKSGWVVKGTSLLPSSTQEIEVVS